MAPVGGCGPAAGAHMIGTTSPETAEAERPADAPPAPEVEGGLGDVTVAVVAVVLPFLVALYAILTTGKALEGRWKFILVAGTVALYSLALVGLGVLLARKPARALAGRTLVVCGSCLAALLAAAGWFISGRGILPLVLANAAAAAALALLAAVVHARMTGERPASAWILAGAVLLLGLSGGRNVVLPRAHMMVLDAAASLLACGVFLRPGPVVVPLGRVAAALAVPLAAFVLRPLWETTQAGRAGGVRHRADLVAAGDSSAPVPRYGQSAGGGTDGRDAGDRDSHCRQPPAAGRAGAGRADAARRRCPPRSRRWPGGSSAARLGCWWCLVDARCHLGARPAPAGSRAGPGARFPPAVAALGGPVRAAAGAAGVRAVEAAGWTSSPREVERDPDALPGGTGAEVLGWLVVPAALALALIPAAI